MTTLEELRSWAHDAPSAEGWARLCAALETPLPDGDLALDYLEGHLATWPITLRAAPAAWAQAPAASWGGRCCRRLAGCWTIPWEAPGVGVAAAMNAALDAWVIIEGAGPDGLGSAWRGGLEQPPLQLLHPRDAPGDVTDFQRVGPWLALGFSEGEEGVGHVHLLDAGSGEAVAAARLPHDRLRERLIRASRVDPEETEELVAESGDEGWLGGLAEGLEIDLGDFDYLEETVSVALWPAEPFALAAARLDGRLWRVRLRASEAVELIGEHPDACGLLALPEGRAISIGQTSGGQPSLRLWDARRGSLLAETPVETHGILAVSPDGHQLACWGAEGMLLRVEPRALIPERPLFGDRGQPAARGLAWRPDGGVMGFHLRGGRLQVLALESGATLLDVEARDATAACFSEGGRALVAVAPEGLRVWRLA